MKKSIIILLLSFFLFNTGKAQFIVNDPINLASAIVNSINEVVQAGKTTSNMINNFQEVKKVYEQGKEYYDKLKSVHNLVKDAKKVQQSVLMLHEISTIYVESFQRMLQDNNFSTEELEAIAFGYTKLLEEGTDILQELKDIINFSSGLSMTDKERMDIIDRCYREIRHYRELTRYYTNKNISVSYLRAKEKGDASRIIELYGTSADRYW